MSPRRKKAESGEPETSDQDATGSVPKPKKTRATRKKVPAKDAEASIDVQVPAPTVPTPTFGAPIPPRQPVNIPIKPIPQQIVVPPRIVIEPEVNIAEEIEDLWRPETRKADLTAPPSALLQRKKIPQEEVEDVPERPEGAEKRGDEREALRGTIRTGLYRKIAIGFGLPAVIVGALVLYVLLAGATVTVYPQQAEIRSEQDLTVSASPRQGEVSGQVAEVTVSGSRTQIPADSTRTDGVSGGEVTIINQTGNDQVLIPTTRLLTSDGTLFRIKSRVNVPAHGRIKTRVYADKPGASGDIGPSAFTIPGLSADLQKSITAQSESPMTGGVVASGVLSQSDIDKAEADLREELLGQAKDELAASLDPKWTGQAYVAETMNRAVSAAVGETSDGVTVRLTLRVRAAAFDRMKALAFAADGLKRGLTSERELLGTDAEHAEFSLSSADPKDGSAGLHVLLKGKSQVSLNGPAFDPGKLKGKSLSAVQEYFSGIEGVQKVDVAFRPFWIKRMPDLPDHIRIVFHK